MRSSYDEAAYEAEIEELRAERDAERRYQRLLARAPDCRDPDHVGCERCLEDEE